MHSCDGNQSVNQSINQQANQSPPQWQHRGAALKPGRPNSNQRANPKPPPTILPTSHNVWLVCRRRREANRLDSMTGAAISLAGSWSSVDYHTPRHLFGEGGDRTSSQRFAYQSAKMTEENGGLESALRQRGAQTPTS